MQDADDEDLPPLEEDVDEGSRMEVSCAAAPHALLIACIRPHWWSLPGKEANTMKRARDNLANALRFDP